MVSRLCLKIMRYGKNKGLTETVIRLVPPSWSISTLNRDGKATARAAAQIMPNTS